MKGGAALPSCASATSRSRRTGQGPALDALNAYLVSDFDELSQRVRGWAAQREVPPVATDAILAMGELASSRMGAAAFVAQGIPAAWVDARRVLVTDAEHTMAVPDTDATCRRTQELVASRTAAGEVPVLGGFIGATAAGVTTTLGRGGSDYSAAIFGACLDVEEIQIWTDVDGMLTADPRVVADPVLVPQLSFSEASELAYFGAKVLHPSTILPAVAKNIPVRILNSRRPEVRGTMITAEGRSDEGHYRARLQARADRRGHHLDAHADGARLPAAPVRSVRALPDLGGRRHHLRSERVGDGGQHAKAGRHRRQSRALRRGRVRAGHGDCLHRGRKSPIGSGALRACRRVAQGRAAPPGVAGGIAPQHHHAPLVRM